MAGSGVSSHEAVAATRRLMQPSVCTVSGVDFSVTDRPDAVTRSDAAFTERFSQLRGRLLAVCTGLVGADDAEDVVQDAYLRARARRGELRDAAAFDAWLMRIAINLCYSRHQRARTLRRLLPAIGRADVERPRDLALRDLIERLPPRERTVLVLHYGHGYQLEEIARLLGLSAVNVRAIASRSRRALGRQWRESPHG
jgi:RNA polymerase sigma factor (sigma-70 family)